MKARARAAAVLVEQARRQAEAAALGMPQEEVARPFNGGRRLERALAACRQPADGLRVVSRWSRSH